MMIDYFDNMDSIIVYSKDRTKTVLSLVYNLNYHEGRYARKPVFGFSNKISAKETS